MNDILAGFAAHLGNWLSTNLPALGPNWWDGNRFGLDDRGAGDVSCNANRGVGSVDLEHDVRSAIHATCRHVSLECIRWGEKSDLPINSHVEATAMGAAEGWGTCDSCCYSMSLTGG